MPIKEEEVEVPLQSDETFEASLSDETLTYEAH